MSENQMLDFNLDDLEDLPEFPVPPAGVYKLVGVSMTTEQREKIGTTVVVKVKLLETLELKNPQTDVALPNGTEVEYSFPLNLPDSEQGTKFSQGGLKAITKPLAAFYGVPNFVALAEKFPGTEFSAVMTVRVNKDDKDIKYSGIKTVTIG